MPAKTLDTRDENQLVTAIKEAVAMVDRGMTPNAAIEKIARTEQMLPGAIKLVCAAYNTGRQTSQREDSSLVLDKFASFQLADPDAVISAIYGTENVKSATFAALPSISEFMQAKRFQEKTASYESLPLTDKKVEPIPPDPEIALRVKFAAVNKAKLAEEQSRGEMNTLSDALKCQISNVVAYFRKYARDRLPFDLVEKSAAVYFGEAAKTLLELVYQQSYLKEKRAGAAPIVSKHPIDLQSAPFSDIAGCIKLAKAVNLATAKYNDAVKRHAEAKRAAFSLSDEKADGEKDSADDAIWSKEAAGVLATPAFGAAVTTMLMRGNSMAKSRDDLVNDAWLDLDSPSHLNEIRKIRVRTMLNSMLTDPDDPISSHDPDTVLQAYNELAQYAPRVAEQPAAIKPLLRRRLAGNFEPFEAKEVGDIENTLLKNRTEVERGEAKK